MNNKEMQKFIDSFYLEYETALEDQLFGATVNKRPNFDAFYTSAYDTDTTKAPIVDDTQDVDFNE